jgi:hypothetical protein
MIGFGLLCGHMVGDYIVQTDWQAKWKSAIASAMDPSSDPMKFGQWNRPWYRWRPLVACTLHCLLYTLAVWAFSFSWMPWWGLIACFAAHWPIDRFRLAGRWMRNISGQGIFASPPPIGMAPWSVIVVDNTFHLVTLYIIAVLAGVQLC